MARKKKDETPSEDSPKPLLPVNQGHEGMTLAELEVSRGRIALQQAIAKIGNVVVNECEGFDAIKEKVRDKYARAMELMIEARKLLDFTPEGED